MHYDDLRILFSGMCETRTHMIIKINGLLIAYSKVILHASQDEHEPLSCHRSIYRYKTIIPSPTISWSVMPMFQEESSRK